MAAQQFQAAQKVIDDANWFLNYRDPAAPPYTPQTLDAFWRQNNYVEPSPPGPAPQFPGWPAARAQFPPPAVLNHQQQFLNKAIPELANLPSPALAVNWVGQKFLAEGGTGIVGMWQYNGPPTNVSMPRRVVVKELLPNRSAFDLQEEADHINALSQFNSDHIVALVQKNPMPTTGAAEGLGPEWDGVVRRMILEYSSLGDLDDLLDIRMGIPLPFPELTLWRMFDCLVDGICVFEYGRELVNSIGTREIIEPPKGAYKTRVHFDLKPGNILIADERAKNHPVTPVCKLGDFGFTEIIDTNAIRDVDLDDHYFRLRKYGTLGYLAPEQFTERWDHADYDTGGVAGAYSYRTNIWGIGCIMFQLLTLSNNPPDQTEPFVPGFTLNGAPARGIAYGINLQTFSINQGQNYSQEIIELIYECLYEKPVHRPTLVELKTRVRNGIEACIAAGEEPEPWSAFLPPPAALPPVLRAPPAVYRSARKPNPPPAVGTRIRCRHIMGNGRVCPNMFPFDGMEWYCSEPAHRANHSSYQH